MSYPDRFGRVENYMVRRIKDDDLFGVETEPDEAMWKLIKKQGLFSVAVEVTRRHKKKIVAINN